MLNKVGLVMVAAMSVLAAGCVTTGAKGSAADEAAVRAVLDVYTESINEDDVDLHASIWDEAGVMLKGGQPLIVGTKALRERWEKNWAIYANRMVITISELIVTGDWALARCAFTNEAKPKTAGSGTNPTNGNHLMVFKREPDGTWKIYADAVSLNAYGNVANP
jgi:ketosteroid isomerase-like protein